MGKDNSTLTQNSVSTFTVRYISPVNADVVDLVCSRSTRAKTRADCLGGHDTDAGPHVTVVCDITLGAASGPGCASKAAGDPQGEEHKEYLYPPGNNAPNPHYLRDWEEAFRDFLRHHHPSDLPEQSETTTPAPDLNPLGTMGPAPTDLALTKSDKLRKLKSYFNELVDQPDADPSLPAVNTPCAIADFRCRVTDQNMMYPPSAESEASANVLADPCLPTSLCSTWRYIRVHALTPFGKKLTN